MKTAEYLLLEISCRETKEDMIQAEKSLDEFIGKYGDFCKRLIYTQSRNNQAMFEDLYRLFILEIWNKADQFDNDRSPEDSDELKAKKWLKSRMKAVIRTYWFELSKDDRTVHIEELMVETYLPPELEEELFEEVEINEKKLSIAMIEGKILSSRELDILKTTYEFRGEIPEEIRTSICRQYNIADSTIRTIRFRALKKLKEFVKQKSLIIK